MMKAVAFLLLAVSQVALAAEWALLVAGSNGYYNYRHQSDVCHAYQVLIAKGFPADHIVTMMYDDIANNHENPVKGELINKPNGPNVYEGCVKDYTGSDVTPPNFLKILAGESMAGVGSGRVIASTSEDSVFVYFSDHGATGLIAFPDDELYARDLYSAIKGMHEARHYKQLLFYLEACESGSMFYSLLDSSFDVLAVTAADPTESSYAIYYDDKRATYLGDAFSVYWMQDAEAKDTTKESIETQFEIVKELTNTSHVCMYGDTAFKTDMLSKYIGSGSAALSTAPLPPVGTPVSSRDVPRAILARRVADAASPETAKAATTALAALDKLRARVDLRFEVIALRTVGRNATAIAAELAERDPCTSRTPAQFGCLKQLAEGWKAHCGKFDDYSLKHVKVLNEICNAHVPEETALAAIADTCARI